MKVRLLVTAVLLVVAAVSGAFSQAITVDNVTPTVAPGQIPTAQEITVDFRFNNTTAGAITGFSNGFKIYSPSNATWTTASMESTGTWGRGSFDGGVFFSKFNVDGSGEDTVGAGGFALFGTGVAAGSNTIAFRMKLGPIPDNFHNGTICIDSSFYPPGGEWVWSDINGSVYPTWGGPYCYTIKSPNPPQKNIVLSRTAIDLTFTEGTNPGNETFNITSDGEAIALTISDDQTWMSVSPGSGTTPQLATVSFTAAALAPGTYNGTITVTGTDAANSPRTVAVTLHVNALPSNLVVSPDTLFFSATEQGSNPANQNFTINTDNDPLTFDITDDQTWLSVSPTSGSTPANPAASVNITGLTAGTYIGHITITSAGAVNSPEGVTVKLTVDPKPVSNLVLSESLLNFTAQENGANPANQGFSITSSNLPLDIGVSDNAAWLSVSTSASTTPSNATVSVSIAGLAAGEYDGTITVTSATADNSPQVVNVHLSVIAEPVYVIVVAPIELNFTAEEGGANPASQNVNVSEATDAAVSFAVTENASWLSFDPTSGNTPTSIAALVDISGLTPGNYSEIVNVDIVNKDRASSKASLTVNLTVTAKPVLLLAVEPTVLNFAGVAGGANPSPQSFAVTEVGGGNVSFDAAENTSWFGLTNLDATTPGGADVAVDITGLLPGNYQGFITLTSVETENDPIQVEVNLTLSTPSSDADSVYVANVPAIPGIGVSVPVTFLNSCDLTAITAGLEWTSADITLDSVSFAGSRTADFTNSISHTANGDSHQLIIGSIAGQGIDPVPAGWGLLATMWFTVSGNALPSIVPITFMPGNTQQLPTENPLFYMDCGSGSFVVEAASVSGSIIIGEKPAFVCGYVVDTAGNPIDGASVQLWADFPNGAAEMVTSSDVTGYFEFKDFTSNPVDVYGFKTGYYPDIKENTSNYDDGVMLVLAPVGEVYPTFEWVNFYCGNNTFEGAPLPLGAVIDAYDPDGIHCGTFTVTEAGKYGFLPVYRDDPYADGDQGAEPGDAIRFYVNGVEAVTDGSTIWTQNGDAFEVCLDAANNVTRNCHLTQGWNLVSWNVDTDSDEITKALASISGCLELVLGFEQGGLTFDPTLVEFSTLHNVDHLSGYWIKSSCDIDLSISGNAVPVSTPISVTKGWNLVSYLPDATLPIETGFASLSGNLIVALGFDGTGLVYQPGQGQFNTLTELSSCFGYWVKVNQNGSLVYPDGAGATAGFIAKAEEGENLALGANGVNVTTRWMNLFARNLTLDGKTVAQGSVVNAVSKDGLTVGSFVMTKSGQFGFMPVYADDPTTSIIEGVIPGETFTLTVNGTATNEEFAWGNVGDKAEVVNLTAKTTGSNLPTSYSLLQNYPNPFNPTTTITFAMPEAGKAKVEVFDLLGRQVATIFDGLAPAGETRVTWDGRNSGGITVSSGVYFYRLTADKFSETKKMTLMK